MLIRSYKLVAALAVLAFTAAGGGPAGASPGRSTSRATRNDEGASMDLKTTELTSGHTVTEF